MSDILVDCWGRLRSVVVDSETVATKFSLLIGAFLTALGFWTQTGMCGYAACKYLEVVMPWWAWGSLWTVYTVIEAWRIFDAADRPRVALMINLVGVYLYGCSAIGVTIARWPFWQLSVFTITMAFASVWVCARTMVNPGHGFRGD